MIRAWIAIALLAASWLPGLGYYHQAAWLECAVLVAAGTLLLLGTVRRVPGRVWSGIATVLFVPAIWLAPWPYWMVPALLAAGGALSALPIPRRWPRRLGAAAVAAGSVLLAQALAMLAYESLTARSHDLPAPLPGFLAAVARLLGIDAAADGSTLVLSCWRTTNRLGATWELFLDPVTACFLAGGGAFLAVAGWAQAPGHDRPRRRWLASAGALALCVLVWLPVRAGLLMALYLHRVLLTEYEAPLDLMDQFWSTKLLVLLTAVPVLLAWRFVRLPRPGGEPAPPRGAILRGLWYRQSALLACAGVCALCLACLWEPVGERKGGRVLVVERFDQGSHPTWEPIRKPYDTEWFGHDAGYNYACIHEYCSRFYDADMLSSKPLEADDLAECDVLVIKIPMSVYESEKSLLSLPVVPDEMPYEWHDAPESKLVGRRWARDGMDAFAHLLKVGLMRQLHPLAPEAWAYEWLDEPGERVLRPRYSPEEVEVIRSFVERGGGLLLIGEHTNFGRTSANLNPIARPFGFAFRNDGVYGIDTVYDQLYEPPLVPHPILQNMPPLDFAGSCTIAPGTSAGCAVIRDRGLKTLMADYFMSNFLPEPKNRPEMRYGAFIQLWATRYGRGRVVAFTDSTVFSNFSTFEPGKAELMLGMLEWLNRADEAGELRWRLAAVGASALAIVLLGSLLLGGHWLLLAGAGMLGWAASVLVLLHAPPFAMALPEAKRPMVKVVIDRTVCDAPLSKSGFIGGKPEGFGVFERWFLRLRHLPPGTHGDEARDGIPVFTTRAKGEKAFSGDLLVFLHPHLDATPEFRDGLEAYVAAGGKVLVVDSTQNQGSTANSLLEPFGLSVEPLVDERGHPPAPGYVVGPDGWPFVPVASAWHVAGGEPFALLNDVPVGASVRYKKGLVVAIGFGSRFTDANMGISGDVVPPPRQDEITEFRPDGQLRDAFDFQFEMIREILKGQPLPPPMAIPEPADESPEP